MNMKCVTTKRGKVHAVLTFHNSGMLTMWCGLRQHPPQHKQRPWKKPEASHCCFGNWQETHEPITCKSCRQALQGGGGGE